MSTPNNNPAKTITRNADATGTIKKSRLNKLLKDTGMQISMVILKGTSIEVTGTPTDASKKILKGFGYSLSVPRKAKVSAKGSTTDNGKFMKLLESGKVIQNQISCVCLCPIFCGKSVGISP